MPGSRCFGISRNWRLFGTSTTNCGCLLTKGVGTLVNISNHSRKEQILNLLKSQKGEWVDGTLLATEEVGGSEGLRRLRELRADGFIIQQRKHPDPDRNIWQYRLADQSEISPLKEGVERRVPTLSATSVGRLVFGQNRFCDRCDGKGRKGGADCPICGGKGWV